MANKKITADEALELAAGFRATSVALGDYLYRNWTMLDSKERDKLRSLEVTLLNLSTDLVTQAAGVILDDALASVAQLKAATQMAKSALAKIEQIKKAINIATALIGLAAAIPTGNIVSIVSALDGVLDAARGKSDKKDEKNGQDGTAKDKSVAAVTKAVKPARKTAAKASSG